jgi:acetyl-CoA acyltransferase 1
MAITTIANQIRGGQIEIGLAVGVESMSSKYDLPPSSIFHFSYLLIRASPDNGGPSQSELIEVNPASRDCSERMGWTSENVAADFNITREEQDAFAAESFQRAERAQKAGYFAKEIVPFMVFQVDPATGERRRVVVTEDDGIRAGTTKEALLKIRPAFPQWRNGTTTGGNASQITDGAAAVLLMTRRKAEELGLEILARHVTTAVAGVPPRIMGVGPVYAIPMALKNAGIGMDDVDLYEVSFFYTLAPFCTIEQCFLDQ